MPLRRRAGQLGAQLARRAGAFRHHVVAVDRLEVELPGEQEVAVRELGVVVERGGERVTNGVLDEARLEMRMLDDEQLVGPLEQLVDGRAHRPFDDLHEVLGVDARLGADEQRAAPALVVGRERDEREDALDVAVGEPGLEQPVGRGAAHEPLCARARHHPGGFDADHPAHLSRRRAGDADQGGDLLRLEAADRRSPRQRVLRLDPYLGAKRVLALDDVPRDVLGQRLHEERLADHDLVDRLPEELGEPGHVHAFLRRVEVDRARDLGGERLLVSLVADPDRLLDTGHARAGQGQRDVGRRCLQVDGGASRMFAIGYEP